MTSRTVTIGSVLAAASCLLVPALTTLGQEQSDPSNYVAFELSRATPRTEVAVNSTHAVLVRVDRDVPTVKVRLVPATGTSAGRWKASVWSVRSSEQADLPNLVIPPRAKPSWTISREIESEPAVEHRLSAGIPRMEYRNFLLRLEPQAGSSTLLLRLEAAPLAEAARREWVVRTRLSFPPQGDPQLAEANPELVRRLVRHLTDDEVRQWTGMAGRDVFLQVWQRMTSEQIQEAFTGPETANLMEAPQLLLPGGYYFTGGARLVPPGAVP